MFYKEVNAAKSEYLDYQTVRAGWEKAYGNKAGKSMSIRERLRQKEQIVKEREVSRVYQTWQKDKGVRW